MFKAINQCTSTTILCTTTDTLISNTHALQSCILIPRVEHDVVQFTVFHGPLLPAFSHSRSPVVLVNHGEEISSWGACPDLQWPPALKAVPPWLV